MTHFYYTHQARPPSTTLDKAKTPGQRSITPHTHIHEKQKSQHNLIPLGIKQFDAPNLFASCAGLCAPVRVCWGSCVCTRPVGLHLTPCPLPPPSSPACFHAHAGNLGDKRGGVAARNGGIGGCRGGDGLWCVPHLRRFFFHLSYTCSI